MRKLLLVLFVFSLVSCTMPVKYSATVYVYDKTGKSGTLSVTVNGVTKEVFGADSWTISWTGDEYKANTAFKKVSITAPSVNFSKDTTVTDLTVENVDIY